MCAPFVEAEQDGPIRIKDLTKVVMARSRLGLAEERLVPFEAASNATYADDRPCAFHRTSTVGLTRRRSATATDAASEPQLMVTFRRLFRRDQIKTKACLFFSLAVGKRRRQRFGLRLSTANRSREEVWIGARVRTLIRIATLRLGRGSLRDRPGKDRSRSRLPSRQEDRQWPSRKGKLNPL